MEVVDELKAPVKKARSVPESPWRESQFSYSRLESGATPTPSPVSLLFSRHAARRYGKLVLPALGVLLLTVFGLHLVDLGPVWNSSESSPVNATIQGLDELSPDVVETPISALEKPSWPGFSEAENTHQPSAIQSYGKPDEVHVNHEPAMEDHRQPESPTQLSDGIDWSKYAYTTYATDADYLCNAVMMFAQLNELKTPADKVLIYPEEWIAGEDSATGRLLQKARDEYMVHLNPVRMLVGEGQEFTWAESFTKLLVFNLTRWEKVVYMDNDGMILQSLDELFSVPLFGAAAALPRAYWVPDQPVYGSHFMVVAPSTEVFETKMLPLFQANEMNKFDMDIINKVLGSSCLVLPHRPLAMLSGEFFRTSDEHRLYLGLPKDADVHWDPDVELAAAKTIHFSDWPILKPWLMPSVEEIAREAPPCREVSTGRNDTLAEFKDCRDHQAWMWLREEFWRRRRDVCSADA